MNGTILIYGATGYTGKLIAKVAADQGARPILAGRNLAKVNAVARPLGLNARAFDLGDRARMDAAIKSVSVVLNVAGPFSATSRPVAGACLRNRVHYLDITGEIEVFEALAARDAEAKARGVMLLPGVGFDVVPSDCLVAHLKRRLPDANDLNLVAIRRRLRAASVRSYQFRFSRRPTGARVIPCRWTSIVSRKTAFGCSNPPTWPFVNAGSLIRFVVAPTRGGGNGSG